MGGGEPEKKQYATFIAHDWKNKVVAELSCDPRCIANYFTKSDLPFETTPAFFQPDVLIKYKSDPEKYEVKERSITRRHAWHLQTYDINEAGQVHTYLIYLSRLPYQEQLYWKSFNEMPKAPISQRALATDFKGEFADFPNPLGELKRALLKLSNANVSWWKLRAPGLMERVHYPVTDGSEEWANEIFALDQLLVEGFNRAYFRAKAESFGCVIDPTWGSIRLIKEILIKRDVNSDEAEAIVNPLTEVHRLRSLMKGHPSGNRAATRAQLIKKHRSLKEHFRVLVAECGHALNLLSEMMDKAIL